MLAPTVLAMVRVGHSDASMLTIQLRALFVSGLARCAPPGAHAHTPGAHDWRACIKHMHVHARQAGAHAHQAARTVPNRYTNKGPWLYTDVSMEAARFPPVPGEHRGGFIVVEPNRASCRVAGRSTAWSTAQWCRCLVEPASPGAGRPPS